MLINSVIPNIKRLKFTIERNLMQETRARTCCFTGHRKLSKDEIRALERLLPRAVTYLISRGVYYFGSGGALGFDLLASDAVLKCKADKPEIKLIMVLACREQDKFWADDDRKLFHGILARADKTVYISDEYYDGCMLKRDRHLVDHSAHCVCYLRDNTGGTAYTIQFAGEHGLKKYNLYDKKRGKPHV